MKLDLKNKITQRIFIYSVSLIIAIFAYLLFTRINDILHFLSSIVSLLAPFLIGFGLAFILEGPVLWFENRLSNFMKRKKRVPFRSFLSLFSLFCFSSSCSGS
ncbi:hypothetical protein [Allobaculum sp. Allo2]|uniref:hypothetical protein n=1 Tax=Allobaculum sp. Allo2 TaxID=2853432 RepID=UPI001F624B60|nr:hypothetical protein [Allobaculum sp. Allo2]UNT92332.1 hypothetical protein KWG61_08995 [Allobaculum sp. Allo2]